MEGNGGYDDGLELMGDIDIGENWG